MAGDRVREFTVSVSCNGKSRYVGTYKAESAGEALVTARNEHLARMVLLFKCQESQVVFEAGEDFI